MSRIILVLAAIVFVEADTLIRIVITAHATYDTLMKEEGESPPPVKP